MVLKEALVILAAVGAVLGLLEWRFNTLEHRLNDRMSLYLHQQLVLENRISALERRLYNTGSNLNHVSQYHSFS